MASNDELNVARKKLFEKLGDNAAQYCYLMKLWFSMKMTKEEFDAEARRSMNSEQMRLHNEFLIALFSKCNLASELCRNRIAKRAKLAKQKRIAEKSSFQPADPINYLPQLESPPQHLQEQSSLRFSAQELFLPNQSFIQGRLMLAAWEQGMDGADDAAADLLVVAVQYFLKNVLTAVFTQRSGYRLKDNRIICEVGASVPNPWLRNYPTSEINIETDFSTSTSSDLDIEKMDDDEELGNVPIPQTNESIEQSKMYRKACAEGSAMPLPKRPVSANDVLQALMVHKSCVPAHSVYAINLEKIICSLYHPDYEDLEAMSYL